MAIELGSETISVSRQERTRRVEIIIEHGEDPILHIHREIVTIDGNGKVLSRDRDVPVVARRLSKIGGQTFTVGGTVLTGAKIADLIAGVSDTLRIEDIDTAAAEAAAEIDSRQVAKPEGAKP